MKAYKGFNKDMTCRGFQFEEGKTYEESEAILYEKGFHACMNPLDIFTFYPPTTSVYHRVDLDGVTDEKGPGTQICGTKIKIKEQLTLIDIIKNAIYLLRTKTAGNCVTTLKDYTHAFTSLRGVSTFTSGYGSHSSTVGNNSHALAAGSYGSASTTGFGSHAIASGLNCVASTAGNYSCAITSKRGSTACALRYDSQAITMGYCSSAIAAGESSIAATSMGASHAVSLGGCSCASALGKDSVAAAIGRNSSAKAAMGSWIVLAEYGDWNGQTWPVLCVKCGKIDGVSLKPDTWYHLKDGEFVEGTPESGEEE